MEIINKINQLHKTWESVTGQVINLRATERIWYEFASMDFTEDDLRCVLADLMRFNRASNGAKFRINLQKICGDPETFASLLGEARAKERNRKKPPTAKDQVLQNLRPTVGEPLSGQNTRTLSEVFQTIATPQIKS